MMYCRSGNNQGFALPTLMMVMMILLLVATTIGYVGFSSLRVSEMDHDSNEALFAAEAGLVAAAEELSRNGVVADPFELELPNGTKAKVTTFINETIAPMKTVHGVEIPPGTVYLHSLGTSTDGRNKEAGILMERGFGFFRVGALGKSFDMANSTFDAFSSDQAPYPASSVNDAMIAASNEEVGDVFKLTETDVRGGVFVGTGGDPTASIIEDGSSNVARKGALSEPLEVDLVVIPDVSDSDMEDDLTPGDHSISFPTIPEFSVARSGDVLELIYHDGSGLQFEMVVQENGDFTLTNQGPYGLETAVGNIQDGTAYFTGYNSQHDWPEISSSGGNTFTYQSQGSQASQRSIVLDPSGNLTIIDPLANDSLELPSWAFGGDGPPSVTNPDLLEGGEYENVTIDSTHTELQSGETFVVENLEVTSSGALALPEDAESVNIYVRNRLILDGEEAVLNDTRKAPKLNIFYLGSESVQMRGGATAYFTLFAPEADLELSGTPNVRTEFYGALVGKSIDVNHANFHFDLATLGVGEGNSGGGFQVVARPRY